MTVKEKLIKIKSLADKMSDTAFNMTTDASLLRKAIDEYHQFIINEYHKEEQIIKELQEKPVSDDLEEAAEQWDESLYRSDAFKAGAKWQKEHVWKPSEEMLEALYRVIPENVMEKSEDEMLLDKLYQGLKYGKVLSEK